MDISARRLVTLTCISSYRIGDVQYVSTVEVVGEIRKRTTFSDAVKVEIMRSEVGLGKDCIVGCSSKSMWMGIELEVALDRITVSK